ncbi:MAG: hypothetical protein QF568_05475 [Flavobacteriales bacterium]|jgi:hypothetical protein|nr:hypothetical protein [Flavobacteriales bacterium]|tara:strand:- start:703 stop:1194 length:492 start_codon:yes stop_codon:yes gene_type:complete
MPTIELIVSLKVPDNVAITAFNTLKRMGYKLKKLERADYYKFDVKDDVEDFKKQISKADILVNANKNKFSFSIENNNNINNKKNKNNEIKFKKINILVQDLDNGSSLLSTLKERLGFKNIKKLEKGILWTMYFDKKVNAKKIAVDITKNLLMNENYQKYGVLG